MQKRKKAVSLVISFVLLINILLLNITANVAGASTETVAAWNYTAAPLVAAVPATSGTNAEGAVLKNFRNVIPSYSTTSLCVLSGGGNWDGGSGSKYWEISLSSKQYENLTVSANTRSSGTGPRDFKLVYSINNGTDWKDVSGGTYSITGTSLSNYMPTVSLPAEAADCELLRIRFIMTSNTSQSGATVASGGTSNINNVIVSGTKKGQLVVASVEATPAGGAVDANTQVDLTCGTSDAQIYFSINDSVYSQYDPASKITLSVLPAVLKTYAAKTGYQNSETSTFSYKLKDPVPQDFNLYFGQLHSHTGLSDGNGTPDEAYAWARDQGKADFLAVTDHSNSFDNEFASENITKWSDSTSAEWKQLNTAAEKYNENNKFVAIAGYEMTWSNSTIGHINTFNTPWFMSRDNGISLSGYYDKLRQSPQSISQFNHPGTTFGYFEQFGNYSQEVDNVINLIEVGNGEGPVHGSGYFPSYEYYTKALDKGWHLAPSNNQDNHNKGWITANDARTVVLAPELTRDAIYEAIRNYRVYSTEDKNLQVSYKVNDQVMGSSIGKEQTLHFSIQVEDPDAADSISSVSVISDGGAIAATKTFEGNKADWSFDLPNNNSYYYVRIAEKDQDIAVTAPVWSGKLIPAGLTSVSASQNPTTPGMEVELKAVLYNNSTTALGNTTVEFYNGSEKIGENTVATVTTGSTGNAVIKWTPAAIGTYTITAKASITVGSDTKQASVSTEVKVLDSTSIKRVVIDGGHYNAYITGNYSGSYTELKQLLDSNSYITEVNLDALTADDLAGAEVLILSDPGSVDDTYSKKSFYTEQELVVISNFVQAGGSVIVTSAADYGEASKGITGDYQSAVQNNKVLEAVGSNMRFNDDELYDTTKNVDGMAYKLDFDEYVSQDRYGIIKNNFTAQKFRVYSSSSVIAKTGSSLDAVDWLVNLHSTTTSYDSDGSGDSINPADGTFHVIGAELLPGGGKVAAAGATFFSNYEFSSTLDSALSNKEILTGMLDWMTAEGTTTISNARVDADGNNVPDLLGKEVTVEGVVTAESTAYTESHSRNNAFFDCIYVQDETGGITVFKVSKTELPIGAKVRITGKIDQYQGDTEIQVENETSDVVILDAGPVACEPKPMGTGDSMTEAKEGWLVKVTGKVTRIDGNNLYVDDGTGEARIFLNGYIGDGTGNVEMYGKWKADIQVGSNVSAIGFASEDPDGHRLRVRNTAEVSVMETPVSATTALTGPSKVKPGDTLTLGFKLNGAQAVAAQDIVIGYDPETYEFIGATSLIDTVKIWGTKAEGGKVEILQASSGAENVITGNLKVFNLEFKVKALKLNSQFAVTKAELSNASGEVTLADLSELKVTMNNKQALGDLITAAQGKLDAAVEGRKNGEYPAGVKARLANAISAARQVYDNENADQAQIDAATAALQASVSKFDILIITDSTGDFNGNKSIDVGDLGLAAANYGMKEGDAGWSTVSKYDIDGDGDIDMYEMTFIALRKLGL